MSESATTLENALEELLRRIIREKIPLIASPSEEDLMVIHKYKLVYPGVRLIQDW